jgi:hypothetical protein
MRCIDNTSDNVALGGQVAACVPTDQRFAGWNPAEDDDFLKAIKFDARRDTKATCPQ